MNESRFDVALRPVDCASSSPRLRTHLGLTYTTALRPSPHCAKRPNTIEEAILIGSNLHRINFTIGCLALRPWPKKKWTLAVCERFAYGPCSIFDDKVKIQKCSCAVPKTESGIASSDLLATPQVVRWAPASFDSPGMLHRRPRPQLPTCGVATPAGVGGNFERTCWYFGSLQASHRRRSRSDLRLQLYCVTAVPQNIGCYNRSRCSVGLGVSRLPSCWSAGRLAANTMTEYRWLLARHRPTDFQPNELGHARVWHFHPVGTPVSTSPHRPGPSGKKSRLCVAAGARHQLYLLPVCW